MATTESSGIRLRKRNPDIQASAFAPKIRKRAAAETSNIPKYVIDLSLPPAERYRHVAEDLQRQVASLPVLFDEVVQSIHPRISVSAVRSAAQLLLRRVHDEEQNEELKGIPNVTGVLSRSSCRRLAKGGSYWIGMSARLGLWRMHLATVIIGSRIISSPSAYYKSRLRNDHESGISNSWLIHRLVEESSPPYAVATRLAHARPTVPGSVSLSHCYHSAVKLSSMCP